MLIKAASKFGILLLSTLITFFIFELLLQISNYLPEYKLKLKTLPDNRGILFIQLDPELLYRVKPQSGPEINAYGVRDREFDSAKTKNRLFMLGDSFMMANNLDIGETVPRQLEQALDSKLDVFNMGVSGYGPDQGYLRLNRDGFDLKPDAIILNLFPGNDFRDLLLNGLFQFKAGTLSLSDSNPVQLALPRFRLELLGRLALTQRFLPQGTEDNLSALIVQDKVEFLDEISEADRATSVLLMQGILRLYRDTLKAKGVNFSVTIYPALEAIQRYRKAKPGSKNPFVNEHAAANICETLGIDYLDLTSPFLDGGGEVFFDLDYRHLNAKGAEFAADHILANFGL